MDGPTYEDETSQAEAITMVAQAIHRLGNAEASTPYGGLEALGMAIIESAEKIAGAIERLADAIESTKE